MKSIKVIVRQFVTKKDNKSFMTIRARGQYLPLATVQPDINYSIRLCGEAKVPTKEGIYEMAFEDTAIWLDTRPEVAAKNIVRCKATRLVFQKPLPVFDKTVKE